MRENAKISLIETKNYIITISDELIQSFKEVIDGDWGLDHVADMEKVFLIDIEVFADGYGLALYPCDNEVTQLGYKKLLEKYSDGPLRGDSYNCGLDVSSYDFDNEQDSKEIDEYYQLLTKFYFEWISNCWDRAGGTSFLKPIYVMMHDGDESFDLNKKEWITDVTKWLQ
jgi:hypothetical protein